MEFILFVHIPKTAGTSFRIGLIETLGEKAVMKDYGEVSPETSPLITKILYNGKPDMGELWKTLNNGPYKVLSGHFSARKFPFANQCRVITFVREPLARAVSEYFHEMRYNHLTLGIEEYLLNEERTNIQYDLLKGIGEGSIIGVSERFLDTVKLIFFQTGIWTPYLRENINPHRKKASATVKLVSNTCRERFYRLNAKDLELYQKAVRTLDESLSAPVSANKRRRYWLLTAGFFAVRPILLLRQIIRMATEINA